MEVGAPRRLIWGIANVCLHLRPFPSIEGRRPGGARRDRICRDTPAKTRPRCEEGRARAAGAPSRHRSRRGRRGDRRCTVLSATPLWGQTAWQSNGGPGRRRLQRASRPHDLHPARRKGNEPMTIDTVAREFDDLEPEEVEIA